MTETTIPPRETQERSALLDRPLAALVSLNWETVAWIALLVVAAVTRFYDLGVRAMSHDESLHALYSYYLYDAGNYEHNPMMHGPFLFHANALMYFLFGVSDYTARIVPALAGMGVVGMAYAFRRYIGRTGALLAAVLLTLSPSLLFHSRYIRNDIYIALFTLIWIYGAFRYLDTRQFRNLVIMTVGMALGFVTKENHFMTGAVVGAFFAGLAAWQLIRGSGGWSALRRSPVADVAMVMLTLVIPFLAPFLYLPFIELAGWEQPNWQAPGSIAREVYIRYGVMVAIVIALSLALAYFWFGTRKQDEADDEPLLDFGGWARLMTLFWIIEVLFFTTFLTNTLHGLATGVVGSLGYWLEQQEVARGGQPWYYYFMLTGLYEFLPALLSVTGATVIIVNLWRNGAWNPTPAAELPSDVLRTKAAESTAEAADDSDEAPPEPALPLSERLRTHRVYFVVFCIWWVFASYSAYTIAGEKMPWLLTHMALPMCMLGGWFMGRLLHRIEWDSALRNNAVWLAGIMPALILTSVILLISRPGLGRDVAALGETMRWLLALILSIGLLYLIWRWGRSLSWMAAARLLSVGLVALLLLLTVRFSFMLTFINYDMATEYLVYAHGGPDIKRALNEIDLISERTVGGRNIAVAYDDESSWPLSWYMRLYPNSKFYGATPNSDAMSAPVIIVSTRNSEKVRPYVARDYVKRTYRLVWWPDQGYFNLTPQRFWSTITDPQKMENIFQIVFFRRYPDETNPDQPRDLTLWPNRHEFEMYVRRDIAAEIWDLGVAPVAQDTTSVFAQVREREIDLSASVIYNGVYDEMALLTPRAVAVGPGGERVIADTGNHRIVVLDGAGNFLRAFGGLCNLAEGEASGCVDPDGSGPLELGDGQMNEPWGVAVGADGTIFVSDTWNGRVQVFDSAGNFVRKWGYFNSTNAELGDPLALFGPRGLAVGGDGNLLVADTGNKRILQFTPAGELVRQVGGGGVIGGHFEEPVGVAVDPNDGSIFVADTWNRRIQKLSPTMEFLVEWPVPGWESQLIFHKPYIAVAANGDVYASDPEMVQIYVYGSGGELKAAFGNYGTEPNRFAMPQGLAADPTTGSILVADADNNRVMAFPQVQ